MAPRLSPPLVPNNRNNGPMSPFAGSGVTENIWYTLYDRQSFASATAQTKTYFASAGTDDLVSNFEGAGAMPAGQQFVVHSLRVVPAIGTRADDVSQLMGVASILFTKENAKRYLVGPLWQFPSGAGLISETISGAAAALAPANSLSVGSNGVPAQGNTWQFRLPVPLLPQQSFKIQISTPASITLSGSINVYVQLVGVLQRNLQ
jgi:hypothetical protein